MIGVIASDREKAKSTTEMQKIAVIGKLEARPVHGAG